LKDIDMPSFARPTSVAALLDAMAADPPPTLIAGGTDVAVDANLRARYPHRIVAVDAVDELRVFEERADRVVIGAALPLTDLGRRWTNAPPAVREWLELFASPLIRNRATLGGNLATASPIGDAAPLLIALDASVEVADASGRRSIAVSSFFAGYRRTVIDGRGVIVSIHIPKPLPRLLRFYKVSKRRLDDISTVAAAMAIDLDPAGRLVRPRFGFGGVAATPARLTAAESAAEGRPWNLETARLVQQAASAAFTPLSDHRGSQAYRRAMTSSLIEKFWWETRA
jgi:xanthine dehydrogenase small subunit